MILTASSSCAWMYSSMSCRPVTVNVNNRESYAAQTTFQQTETITKTSICTGSPLLSVAVGDARQQFYHFLTICYILSIDINSYHVFYILIKMDPSSLHWLPFSHCLLSLLRRERDSLKLKDR